MKHYSKIFSIACACIVLTTIGCGDAAKADQLPNQPTTPVATEPESNTGGELSFTAYDTLCELVKDSCGQGELLTHKKTDGPVESNGKILTTHIFENGSGETVQVLEECGQLAAPADNVSGGQCRLTNLIEGQAFIVWTKDGYLLQGFRTDQVAGLVTDIFGTGTNFQDLVDVSTRWSSLNDLGPNCDGAVLPTCSFEVY